MSVVLADLGGTHLRLAKAGSEDAPIRHKIAEHENIEKVLTDFAPDIESLYLASAIHPRGGVIEDKRFGEKSHWTIDLAALRNKLSLKNLVVLNDLEAACHALSSLQEKDTVPFLPAVQDNPHFDYPPKLLIGIGTGIGHAFLFEKPGAVPFVQRSHGGHMPALALSAEQRNIVGILDSANARSREIIVEDIVSGHGLSTLKSMTDEKNALRLFWEFLGLYCNMLVSSVGAYGGIYLTGGVADELFAENAMDAQSFARYFRVPMVPVVTESLASTPVYYCRQRNMPLHGLATLAGF